MGLGWAVVARLGDSDDARARAGRAGPAAVEVAPIEHGSIAWRRSFSGTLEARAQFVVAAHVSGRVGRLLVDLADPVERGQVVAELDDDERVEGVSQAAAELAVADARSGEAQEALTIAEREFDRMRGMGERGLISESEVDSARAEYLQQQASVTVAQAEVKRATAALRLARVRSGYTSIAANWSGDDAQRVVAQRHVDEGDMVAANAPLFTIVALSPITAVVHVTEKEYAHLAPGQPVSVSTDAYPGRSFAGEIRRIAPVFRESSRQARVELELPNQDGALKPGMFVRADIELERVEDTTLVPEIALVTRDGKTGVFLVEPSGTEVSWRVVETGIRDGDRVEVRDALSGRVVTLGQQLIDDGSAIDIVAEEKEAQPGEDT
ncbi:efflux transporter, RND family, MFP subunit [Haliangium ochraceum DSM 14365]|uniref:Efflux transporter, RND family, MFP subunit n=1 Tax=Haliangium ochraceum (strain DSM 14365 / JCM 11303 / SMP-2) TaxID=502025 RepID=D0LJ51_HALO1|nr:efflux transporter, RND family, MFP subunit [Haliangium ochraceum DSM 14365]